MVLVVLSTAPSAQANRDKEKEMYLGVLNGQVQGNSVVKVTRTLPEPILFRAESSDRLPDSLIISNAEGRPASGGTVWVTIKQLQPESGQEARITLKALLVVDGKKVPFSVTQRGVDVVIALPAAAESVELRTDTPAELEVPANFRGNLQVALQVEGERAS
ncbi:DUF5462 family protein [Erwinia pyrifoliae]|uniref:DUF5462 family protein n=2 Tax=Erwinia pyrifoliae TaxID=79967 RepID=A0ABY5XE40_ERWPY|nr:DUF5462 family protein [Erwinia pyrifoliae]MCU8585592.1 DUF5462 family protein [Erwinia pyrifoliae]UWS31850.1 DUF5462 family protein [Erwinia pyrifoliae]UWS35342.1 DUF5462 family protein [Erwinia pyrifoliae]UXK14114.1 DUF5462 family protein [Erwinia pyrifoliae]